MHETTVRELNQHTAQVLEHVTAGETVAVTRNGEPIAVIRPWNPDDGPVYPFRTDSMGYDEVPVFHGDPDFSQRVDALMKDFGRD